MREQLEKMANAAEALHYKTRYRNYLPKTSLEEVQTIINNIQETLDQIKIKSNQTGTGRRCL